MSWNIFVRNWYIVGEYAYVTLRSQYTLLCCTCGQEYDRYHVGEESKHCMQGNYICGWNYVDNGRWVLHCGYGSDFDMKEFWYINNYPTVEQDPICDWCIRRMLSNGTLIDSHKEMNLEGFEVK